MRITHFLSVLGCWRFFNHFSPIFLKYFVLVWDRALCWVFTALWQSLTSSICSIVYPVLKWKYNHLLKCMRDRKNLWTLKLCSLSFGWGKQNELPHVKTSKMTVRPVKTRISLGIRPIWSESSVCAQWVAKDPSFLHADSEDSDQTGWMTRLIWVFAIAHSHFVGFVMRQLKLNTPGVGWETHVIYDNIFDIIKLSKATGMKCFVFLENWQVH